MSRSALFVRFRTAGSEPGAVARAAGVFRMAWRSWTRRRLVLSLLATDDHVLADMGITRSDIREALRAKDGADPSALLAEAARRRHAARWVREAEAARKRARALSAEQARRSIWAA